MMENKFYFKIDGRIIPDPDSVDYQFQEISTEDSGRTLDGTMDKQVVGEVEYLVMDWDLVPSYTIAQLNSIKRNTYVILEYFSPFENRVVAGEFFTGNPTCQRVGWGGQYGNIPFFTYHQEFTSKRAKKQNEIPDIGEITEGATQ